MQDTQHSCNYYPWLQLSESTLFDTGWSGLKTAELLSALCPSFLLGPSYLVPLPVARVLLRMQSTPFNAIARPFLPCWIWGHPAGLPSSFPKLPLLLMLTAEPSSLQPLAVLWSWPERWQMIWYSKVCQSGGVLGGVACCVTVLASWPWGCVHLCLSLADTNSILIPAWWLDELSCSWVGGTWCLSVWVLKKEYVLPW